MRFATDPALSIGLALLAGMVVQIAANRLRVPGIILLLAAGMLLGPDGLGLIDPSGVGHALHTIVGFGVSVILFEGALLLDLKQLRRQARSIRQLSTVGVLVTAVVAGLGAHYILGWPAKIAVLFGTLVTVTGPTVVTPLVRRMRLQSKIGTVLQAEGIFVDAVGAVLAIVALEVVLGGADSTTIASGLAGAALRLGAGTMFGGVAGFLLAWLLRNEGLIPPLLQRAFVLAYVMALFQIANSVTSESGILSVVVAGIVVGNTSAREVGELREFKEQLTVVMLGLLFILLAADVRLSTIVALGWPGVAMVAFLIVVVRPLNVLAGTAGTDLTTNERAMLSVMAPRGIVAAAIASIVSEALREEGIEGAVDLRAMVFTVIAATVVAAGITGPIAAKLLGLRRSTTGGYVILGAQGVGRALARILKASGADVLLIDSNPQLCRAAEAEGLRILYGSGIDERIEQRAELEFRDGCIGLTANDEVNLLFARRARKIYHVPYVWTAIRSGRLNVTPQVVRAHGHRLLFGQAVDLDRWNQRFDRAQAEVTTRAFEAGTGSPLNGSDSLPLAVQRGSSIYPFDDEISPKKGDLLHIAVVAERAEKVETTPGPPALLDVRS